MEILTQTARWWALRVCYVSNASYKDDKWYNAIQMREFQKQPSFVIAQQQWGREREENGVIWGC